MTAIRDLSPDRRRWLRSWAEEAVEYGLAILDDLDAADEGLEDDELGDDDALPVGKCA